MILIFMIVIKLFFEKEKGYSNVKISIAKSGITNKVYRVEADADVFYYKHADTEYLPIFKKNVSQARILNEKIALTRASKITNKVPKIYHFDEKKNVLITRAIDKNATLLNKELLNGNLNVDLIKNIAKEIKKIHSIKDCDGLDPVFFKKIKIDVAYLPLMKEYPMAIRKLMKNIHEKKCLVHADFNPKNIIVAANDFLIIDWEQALISSPELDLANMIAQFMIKGIHLKRKDYLKLPKIFLEAYGKGINEDIMWGHVGVNMWARIKSAAKAIYLNQEDKKQILKKAEELLKSLEKNV